MPVKKMHGDVPENGRENSGAVSYDLKPSNNEKIMNSMKAPYAVKRITFNPSEANPGERLEVRVPKLNKNEVLVPARWLFASTSTFLAAMPTTISSKTYRAGL